MIVDDGSTDNYLKDVSYSKLKAESENANYFFEKNQGAGAARNLGISKSKGQFISFIDSDDELLDSSKEVLNELSKNKSTDLFLLPYFIVNSKNQIERVSPNDNLNIKDYLIPTQNYHSKYIFETVWGKIYKNSFLSQNQIMFDVKARTCEDVLFMCNLSKANPNIRILDIPFYKYIFHKNSISHKGSYQKVIYVCYFLRQYYSITNGLPFPYTNEYLRYFVYSLVIFPFDFGETKKNGTRMAEVRFVKKCFKKLPKPKFSVKLSIKAKILFFLLKIHFYLFIYIYIRIKYPNGMKI